MPDSELTDERIVRIISGSVLTPLICIDATVEPWSERVAKIKSDFSMVVMGKSFLSYADGAIVYCTAKIAPPVGSKSAHHHQIKLILKNVLYVYLYVHLYEHFDGF